MICPILLRSASRCAETGWSVGKTMEFWIRPTRTMRGGRRSSESALKRYPFSSKLRPSHDSLVAAGKSNSLLPFHSKMELM